MRERRRKGKERGRKGNKGEVNESMNDRKVSKQMSHQGLFNALYMTINHHQVRLISAVNYMTIRLTAQVTYV